MTKIKILFIGLLIVIVAGVLFFYFAIPKKDEDHFFKVIAIEPDNHSVIYIKKKVWGMTSDHQVIVISDTKEQNFVPTASRNYIYNGLAQLFYKIREDSLYIYTLKASPVPHDLITNIKIVQIELENPEMMRLITSDYYHSEGFNINRVIPKIYKRLRFITVQLTSRLW